MSLYMSLSISLFICNFILDILILVPYYNVNIFITYCFFIFFYDQCVILLSTANRHSKPVQAYLKEVFLFLIYYNIIFRSSAPDRKCWMISAAARSSIISISPGILPVSRSFWISAVVQRVPKMYTRSSCLSRVLPSFTVRNIRISISTMRFL